MAIVFGSDIGLQPDAFENISDGITSEIKRVADGLQSNFSRLSGKAQGLASPPRAETVYVDDGFQDVPGVTFSGSGNIGDLSDIQTRRITTQTPQVTVYIKKRLFSSLRNEHDTRFMDDGEKTFIRASKLLFERKCQQISAYEALTKLESLIEEESDLDIFRLEAIRDALDAVSEDALKLLDAKTTARLALVSSLSGIDDVYSKFDQEKARLENLLAEFDKLIKEVKVSRQETRTTWVIDQTADVDRPKVGRGVGVIELTLVDSVRTGLSIDSNDMGSISFSVQDPYNLTMITGDDIELALSTAANEIHLAEFGFTTSSPQEALEAARVKEEELRAARQNRLGQVTGILDSTNPLSESDVSEIVFEVNPSSQAEHKVTGHFAGFPGRFNAENFLIISSQLPSEQQLTTNEILLMQQVFSHLETYVDRINTLSSQTREFNGLKSTEYARRQLRKHYLGKSIVQPMDGVNIYMRGNTFKDNQVEGPFSAFLNNSSFVKSFATDAGAADAVLREEMRQFGISQISVEVYRKIRTDSLLRNAGAHVFGGLVDTVNKSYNATAGQYVLNVSGQSNLRWLNLSRVNVAPSLDQPRGVLEDPLTPLEINTDSATGLITGQPTLSNENVRRLGRLFYKEGVYQGSRLSAENIKQDVKLLGDQAFSVRHHAPGLVYRWKEGVISATQQRNLRTALNGSNPTIDSIKRDVGITVTQSPFANLDIADVISLMVTGFPHNYESFIINAQSVGSFTLGTDDNIPQSFFSTLMDVVRTNNRALGNFEPFKPITITREQMAQRLLLQTDLVKENKELSDFMQNVARLQDLVNQLSDSSEVLKKQLGAQLQEEKQKLRDKQSDFAKKVRDGKNLGLSVYGNDIILDSTNTSSSDSLSVAQTDASYRLRSKLMQIRPQVATKLNRDSNLFIVSDEYDKDLDLQAFVTNLANGEIPIWNSEYKHPIEICRNAAKVIDFELFCDTNGHIQFRPPQYNKIPISLLAKMLLLRKDRNVDLMPPFLRALFKTKREALEQQRDILDIDIQINNLFLFGNPGQIQATNRGDSEVSFSSDGNSVLLAEDDVNQNAGQVTNVVEQIIKLKNRKFIMIGTETIGELSDEAKKIETEVAELRNPKTPNVNTRRQKLLNDLIGLNSQKQRIKETLGKISTGSVKAQSFNATVNNGTRGTGTELNPGQISTILEPFGNLLEDDMNDFLGPGSSSRFIIKDEDIISYDITESDKNIYCRIDVTGQEDLVGDGPGNIAGVPTIWAGATDFDLWKQYGWRSDQAVSKPFFKDAELQCAPYALMLLARQRKDVVRASVTVTGNEFYQLGDVVYLNSANLLYYVYGISHNFSYSGTFQTTLDLRYGHALGEFIPTPLDVIGKNIIKNQRKFNTTFMFRSVAGSSIGRTLSAIIFAADSTESSPAAQSQLLDGDIGAANLISLKNALLVINRFKDSSLFDSVEIRGWIYKDTFKSSVNNRMNVIKEWLTKPVEKFGVNGGNDAPLDSATFPAINKDIIKLIGPIKLPGADEKLEDKFVGKTPSEESYNFKDNAADDSEFKTIEIVIKFKE